MDTIIPAGARILLDVIGSTEAPKGYDTLFGNHQAELKRPLTAMTLDQVIASGPGWARRWKSSAAGRYQFLTATLVGLKQELGLAGTERFDKALQDRLGFRLLERRGYNLYIHRAIDRTEFGKRLAQEWASFPVLAPTRGAHRPLKRGQSYYAGDGLNSALVAPEKIEAVLDRVMHAEPTPLHLITPDPVYLEKVKPVPVVSEPVAKLDKPAMKSKTVWMWISTAAGTLASLFPGIDWRVQLAIVGMVFLFAVYAIVRRRQIAAEVRAIKAEIVGGE